MSPRVSVVMPVYNGERYLREAVESILGQTYGDFEFIIVDDGSTDRTRQIIAEYETVDPRIVPVWQDHGGLAVALMAGVERARGEFIARMDADDVAMPERFERQVGYLDVYPEVVVLGTSHEDIDADGDLIGVAIAESDRAKLRELMLRRGGLGLAHPTVMMRKTAVLSAGGYRREYTDFEDRDLWLRVLARGEGEIANSEEVLLKFRRHLGSVSHTYAREKTERRIRMVRELAPLVPIPVEYLEEFEAKQRNARPPAAADWYAGWCRNAIKSGNRATARKYARLLVRERPLDPSTWKVWLKSFIGQGVVDRLKGRQGSGRTSGAACAAR